MTSIDDNILGKAVLDITKVRLKEVVWSDKGIEDTVYSDYSIEVYHRGSGVSIGPGRGSEGGKLGSRSPRSSSSGIRENVWATSSWRSIVLIKANIAEV